MSYRPFTDTLRTLRDGMCLDELSMQMQMLVQQVQATSKGGRLTLTIDVKPAPPSKPTCGGLGDDYPS